MKHGVVLVDTRTGLTQTTVMEMCFRDWAKVTPSPLPSVGTIGLEREEKLITGHNESLPCASTMIQGKEYGSRSIVGYTASGNMDRIS